MMTKETRGAHSLINDVDGLMAIMPTPATAAASSATARDTVDHDEAARAADALVVDGVNAILTNGTFGEGATLTWDEHRAFAATVIEAVDQRVPVFIGATTLNTRDTITKAEAFLELGADGLLLGRPMWSTCDDDATVRFYEDVASAVPELSIIVYDNPEAFGGKISPSSYGRIAEIPQVVAAKYPALGSAFLADLSAVRGQMRLLPVDRDWYYAWRWAPGDVTGCWSGAASCGPLPMVALAAAIAADDDDTARDIAESLTAASRTFFPNGSFRLFSQYNIQLEKIRIDAAGYISAGPCRPPYVSCPDSYAEGAREAGHRLAALDAHFRAL